MAKDYLFKDFPKDLQVTKEMRDNIKKVKGNLPYRQKAGLFYTDEELEAYITNSLNRPLPGEVKQRKRRLVK